MPVRTIVCLAASKKDGGYCYAGKDIHGGQWVRPVSDDPGHAIDGLHRMVGRGDPAKVGDVLNMTLGDHVPTAWQTENHLQIGEHWQRIATVDYADLQGLADTPASIWGEGRSSNGGVDDDLTEAVAMAFDHSLLLVAVDDLAVSCAGEGHDQPVVKARASFTYNAMPYRLRITDAAWFDCAEGDHDIGEALLCCSLAEARDRGDGSRHVAKLVAAIITPETLG